MASRSLTFGLSSAVISYLHGVFAKYPEIESVLIFGSRAKDTFKEGSDIDLAVIAPAMDNHQFNQLWGELDELPLVFKMDVLHWNQLSNEPLKQKIAHEGRQFYPPSGYENNLSGQCRMLNSINVDAGN